MSGIDNDIIAVAGNWEPLAFERRRGSSFVDDEKRQAYFHSAEIVEKLKHLEVTTVVWHGYKGLGIQHERAEWELLKPFRRHLERAGIELGVYLQCATYFAETFYKEVPEAREWTALDYWGKPQVYSEYYRSYYRHRPCLTHQAFSEYVGRVAQILIKEYGVTFFSADNNAQMPCYTPRFTKAFYEFLKKKYGTDTTAGMGNFVKRYGHPNLENIVLPCGTARRPLESMHALPDPGLQDWVEFRCRLVARNAEIISAASKAANPRARLCFNISYDYGEFNQLVWGTEPEFMAPVADFLFSEDGNHPRVTEDGRLISHVHTCRHLRAMGRRGHFHLPTMTPTREGRDGAVLSLMELAVQNQGCLGAVYFSPFEMVADDPRPATIRFVKQHAAIFTDNSIAAQIAVLRSRHSGTINWLQATEARLLAQQALFQAGFQFDNVIESTLAQLGKYQLLILPETISLPESCLKQIAEYVRGGGRILAIGASMSRDEWGRSRDSGVSCALQGERNSSYGCVNEGGYEKTMLAAWLGLDGDARQRIFTFPRLLHPAPCVWDPDDPRAPVLNSAHHTLPMNNSEFVASVMESLGAPPFVELDQASRSPNLIPTLLRGNRDQRLSLHLLNYRPTEPVGAATIRLRIPGLEPTQTARLIGLEWDSARNVSLERKKDSVVFTLPPFRMYAGVVF